MKPALQISLVALTAFIGVLVTMVAMHTIIVRQLNKEIARALSEAPRFFVDSVRTTKDAAKRPTAPSTTPEPNVPSSEASGYEIVGEHCAADQCLFNKNESDYPIGLATLKGYYAVQSKEAWGVLDDCDTFVVTGGSSEVVRAALALIDSGNTVNSKNEKGQPALNISLATISSNDTQKLKQSDRLHEVELIALKLPPRGTGAPVCYSDMTLIKVK